MCVGWMQQRRDLGEESSDGRRVGGCDGLAGIGNGPRGTIGDVLVGDRGGGTRYVDVQRGEG